uniref:Uncharacterized protein n=1 Tax=Quercus lobata TaxID=97700 RepID=A0A7N2MQ75_QUELO
MQIAACVQQLKSPHFMLYTASNYLYEFQQRPQVSIAKTRQKEIKWKPLASDEIKTSYDGATFEDTSEAWIVVVVWIDSGEILAAHYEKTPLPSSVEETSLHSLLDLHY